MPMFVDTHAHTNDVFFKDDLDEVVASAIEKGVEKIICVSTSLHDSDLSLKAHHRFPKNIFSAVGLYPHRDETDGGESDDILLVKLEDMIRNGRSEVVAIGECGLDLGEVAESERARSLADQERLFLGQIGLALKYDLPILIHCRKAFDEILAVLNSDERFKKLKGIVHFYTGGKKRIKDILAFPGLMFGVGGPVTYDEGLQQVVREIPMNRIVLETDSPLLAPAPYRGQRGEPAHIAIIAGKVSELKGVNLKEIEEQTTKNARRIFGI